MVAPAYLFAGLLSWPAVVGLYRLRARGVEHLPEGGFVLAANHTSNFDPWPLGIPLWPRRQKGLRKKRVARAHTGAARIAIGAKAPLVPAAIKGTDRLSRLGPLRVAFGEPLDLSDLSDLDVKHASEQATERLMARIEELYATL